MTINLPFLCSNAIDSITDIYYDSLYRVIVTLNIFREEKKTNFHQEKLCWFIVVANLKVLERESGHKTLSKKFHHPHRLTPESESRGIKTFWSCFVSLRWNITGQSSHNLDFLDLRPDLWTLGLWGPCHLIIFLTLWCCYSTIHYCTFYEQPWKQNANNTRLVGQEEKRTFLSISISGLVNTSLLQHINAAMVTPPVWMAKTWQYSNSNIIIIIISTSLVTIIPVKDIPVWLAPLEFCFCSSSQREARVPF